MSAPTFGPVDHGTASLLDLLAETNPAIPSRVDEWDYFLSTLDELARDAADGHIDPNRLRARLRGHIAPARAGAFTRRALCAGMVAYTGTHVESDDVTSRNRGKPCRVLRWLGTQTTAPADAGEAEAGAVQDSPVAPEGVSRMREDTTWP